MGNQCGGPTNLGLNGITGRSATSSSCGSAARARRRSRTATRTTSTADLRRRTRCTSARPAARGVFAGKQPSGAAIALGSATDPAGDATYDALGVDEREHAEPRHRRRSKRDRPLPATCHPAGTACLPRDDEGREPEHGAPALRPTPTPTSSGSRSGSCRRARAARRPRLVRERRPQLPRLRRVEPTGGADQCWVGQNAVTQNADGVQLTYPGSTQLTAPARARWRAGRTARSRSTCRSRR